MKKLFLSLGTVMVCTLCILAQTPYDNFAPEQSVKSIIELPEMQFKVTNTDPNSKIRYIEFDKNTLSLNLLNDDGSILKTIELNPDDKKFTTMDPMAEKYYSWSPYAYCMNNPIRYVDPDGRSTQVKRLDDGTYEIIGGDLEDDDLNIYVYTQDKNGNYTIQGESIGVTTSITSFYDSYANEGNGAWATGSILNPNDNNGNIFLQGLMDDDPSLVGYMWNATGGEKYDFKRTNNTESVQFNDTEQDKWYRGMPITNTEFTVDNVPVYSSAKDIGNMAAGYVSAVKGLSWKQARMGFDGLQKWQDRNFRAVEKASSVNAQQYGFLRGQRRLMINNF